MELTDTTVDATGAEALRGLVKRWERQLRGKAKGIAVISLVFLVALEMPTKLMALIAHGGRVSLEALTAPVLEVGTALTVVSSAFGAIVALTIPLILNEGRSLTAAVQVQRGRWTGVVGACVALLAAISASVAISAVVHAPFAPLNLLCGAVGAIAVVLAAATLADTQIDEAVSEAVREVQREASARAWERVNTRLSGYGGGKPQLIVRWLGLLLAPVLVLAVGAAGAVVTYGPGSFADTEIDQLRQYAIGLSLTLWVTWLAAHVTGSFLSWWATAAGWERLALWARGVPLLVLALLAGGVLHTDVANSTVIWVILLPIVALAVVSWPDRCVINPSVLVGVAVLRESTWPDDDYPAPAESRDQDDHAESDSRGRAPLWLASASCVAAVALGVVILRSRRN
jgi:hypothetical protein